ncbi:hypothetical protein PybrP1_008106 [[Pythium] brassicae (nom. inval.)]|nr:hypothetical protein PybrP1_008106 [[Pythium] brassicae (nom. inval.)]
MWSAVKTVALALAAVAALSSSTASAQSTMTTTMTTTTTTTGSSSVSCTVGGLEVSSNYRFVSGRHGVEGSIYATCTGDKPACFVDTRVRDAVAAKSVSCDDGVIHESRRRLGVYMSGASHYWPQGVVCYSYGTAFSSAQQAVFASAMDVYHKKTAVRFVTLDECRANYPTACGGCTQRFRIVSVAGTNDCYATLGYAPDARMDLNFGSGCFSGDGGFRVALHELGHVIGLIHEHTHPNRQVVVLRSQLTLSPDNYMKERSGLLTAYDSGSVMHYSRDTGICIPKRANTVYCDIDETESDGCVVPTADMCDDTFDASFGKAATLAASDIATIAKIYGSGSQTPPTPRPSRPSSVAPVTQAPATMRPVTQAPATMRPVTQAPATMRPATQAPVPMPPATQAPVPMPPATEAPATMSPVTQAPVPMPSVTQAPDTPAVTPVVAPAATPAPTVPAPAPSASAVPTATPSALPTPLPSQILVQGPGEVPSPADSPSPSPVAIQDPIDQSYETGASPATNAPDSSWDNMNQQVMDTDSPNDDRIVNVGEARGSSKDSPAQVFAPTDATPVPAATTVSSGSGAKRPTICDF